MGTIAKAWTVFTVGLVAWLTDVITSTSSDITAKEWLVALTVVIATVGVYVVPNAPQSQPE